ncbi:uncharacterized protein TNCV_4760211 [Trichonephila clavipes]|uniref:Reverse transcriptase domain-containing protein n=1 Tax=Trichonephila clavipes TaxID=2585209 RepID=A0A8X6RIF3_TRICX|nr:uncharacterized protein TNCV_4760211 [Trichonephila clavipes]
MPEPSRRVTAPPPQGGTPHSLRNTDGHLTGRALDWFDVIGYRVVEETVTDYVLIKQALTEQFPVVRNRSELETRFYASYQNHNQRPSDFVHELLKIHKQLNLDMRKEKLLNHIISHRPQRESNRFGGQGVGDNRMFVSRRRSGQSDHRFNNQDGRQGGSRNGAFRVQYGKNRDQGPLVSRPYRYDRVKQEIIDYHMEEMLQDVTIRPIQSPIRVAGIINVQK